MFFLLATAAVLVGQIGIPRPEHPRPDFERKTWLNLNGAWEFRFDADNLGLTQKWFEAGEFDRKINVPFCWESKLSGVEPTKTPQKIGWYRRELSIPGSWANQQVWLRFGAVDYEAKVWVNGKEIGQHIGGYTPFEFDITEALKTTADGKRAVVVVRAFDSTDPFLPTGKQVGWYSTVSGIWQTVWLESRPATYLKDFSVATTQSNGEWKVDIRAEVARPAGPQTMFEVEFDGRRQGEMIQAQTPANGAAAVFNASISVPSPQLWSPESPHLYPLVLRVRGAGKAVDEVYSYVGLRTIGRGKFGDAPYESILLNGKPVYLRGALDQSFNPDGVYTAPSEKFLVDELMFAKSVGLNFLRIHIKPEEPRRLYLADKLGLLIMQDMPNSWNHDARAREHWERTFRETVARCKNHPSIFSWCLFNETWGLTNNDYHNFKKEPETQKWVARMFDEAKKLDSTRLIEDISPCHYDHVKSDIHSWHFYIDDDAEATKHIEEVVAKTFPGSSHNCAPGWKQGTEPLINSEYGSVSAGGGDRDVSWGFRHLTTQQRRHAKIQGYVYTELTDIEWEHNGFANYDRTKKDFGYDAFVLKMTVADLQNADFVGFRVNAGVVAESGELTLHPFVSHFDANSQPTKLRFQVVGTDGDGVTRRIEWKDAAVRAKLYDVVEQPAVVVPILNSRKFAGAVAVELLDAENRRLCCNFVNIITPFDKTLPAAEISKTKSNTVTLRFEPKNYSDATFPNVQVKASKVSATKSGAFVYRLQTPKHLVGQSANVALIMEAAARGGAAKVDWPSRPNAQDYPQTDERKHPSNLSITLDDSPLAFVVAPNADAHLTSYQLPDDPADARGIYSHMRKLDPGAYGYLISAQSVMPTKLKEEMVLKISADAGLSVFDGATGQFPVAPTIALTPTEPTEAPAGWSDAYKQGATVHHARDRLKTLLASGAEWQYSTNQDSNWLKSDFKAEGWKRGPSGFGTGITPGVRIKTNWSTQDLWLLTTLDLPAGTKNIQARVFHDEGVEIYVNGKQLFDRRGYITDYVNVPLTPEQQALFTPGRNVIAVHCRQTSGGQGVDLELLGEIPAAR